MFCQVETPDKLTPSLLDEYLYRGWFRMGQNIFTTNFLNFKNQFYSAIWLRVDLKTYSADNTEVKLRKLNARFQANVNKASITAEKEELFARYRSNLSFEASSSLHQLMFGKAVHEVYNTWEVTVRDGKKLIACGYFDIGDTSAAGITSFYDPAYRKHSLGKYLIYLKMNFCQEQEMTFFYPGYFVPGYSFFDYKLSIGKKSLEYLDVITNEWIAVTNFSPLLSPIRIMQDKLNSLQIELAQNKIHCDLVRYEFFEANLLPELKDVGLFDFPLFLHVAKVSLDPYILVIVFDVRDNYYHLVKCRSLWHSNLPDTGGMYSSQLLKEDHTLVFTSESYEIISAFSSELSKGINIY